MNINDCDTTRWPPSLRSALDALLQEIKSLSDELNELRESTDQTLALHTSRLNTLTAFIEPIRETPDEITPPLTE